MAIAVVLIVTTPAAAALFVDEPNGPLPQPELGLASGTAEGGAGGTGWRAAGYDVRFLCRSVANDRVVGEEGLCPAHVLDEHDAMGQPVLMVDPTNPGNVAFNALHGGRGVHPMPGSEPPTSQSRDNDVHQPHTTFRTTDLGGAWQDMPYYAPDGLQAEGRTIFGVDNAAALDTEGNVVLASLYAYADGGAVAAAREPYHYALGLWKAGPIDVPIDYHTNVVLYPTGDEGAWRASDVHAASVPAVAGTAVLWYERAPEDLTVEDGGPTDRLRVITTADDRGAVWDDVEVSPALTGCRGIAGPVVRGAELLVGCLPDETYVFPSNATTGMQVHAVNVTTGANRHVASTPVNGDAALLVPRGEFGHVVAIASEVDGEGQPHVWISYGDALDRWGNAQDVASEASVSPDAARVLEARVTAAAYRPDTGNLHLVYMERVQVAEGVPLADAEAQYVKSFVALKAEGDVLAVEDLQVGQVRRADLATNTGDGGLDVFEDLHDDIVVWTDPFDGTVREFVAFGDHGFVRFGEVVEDNAGLPIVPLTPAAPGIPLAVASTTPVLAALGMGILSTAMVVRLVRARSTVAAEVKVKE